MIHKTLGLINSNNNKLSCVNDVSNDLIHVWTYVFLRRKQFLLIYVSSHFVDYMHLISSYIFITCCFLRILWNLNEIYMNNTILFKYSFFKSIYIQLPKIKLNVFEYTIYLSTMSCHHLWHIIYNINDQIRLPKWIHGNVKIWIFRMINEKYF